ncbi:MAG: hypothetical protein ACD_39C00263G0001, partial [uncultured bacterium]
MKYSIRILTIAALFLSGFLVTPVSVSLAETAILSTTNGESSSVAAATPSSPIASSTNKIKAMLKDGSNDLSEYFKTDDDKFFLDARTKLEDILLKQPSNETASMLLGTLYVRKAQNIADAVAARTNMPDAAQFQLGNLFLSQKRFEEAIKCYEKCNTTMPKWSCPFRHKGEALLRIGKNEEAIAALEKAIETRKNHFDAYVFLAEAQLSLALFDKTEKTLADAVEVAKGNG